MLKNALRVEEGQRKAADAKLADIAVLHRAVVLMADADNLHDAMGKVLDREDLEEVS